jgi:sugar O-acyltransferase (sialic acid O-acetyltransferase NeuD family)
MKDIVILGAAGFAREVAWLIDEINRQAPTWNFLGYVEADPARVGQPCGDATIVGDDTFLENYAGELHAVIGIGRPPIIERLRHTLERLPHVRFPNLIHPSVLWDRKRIQIDAGNILCAGNILTTDIRIGSFNILNLASTFGHDAVIGDHCVINPGVNLSGGVTLGDTCLLGTSCTILENLTLGPNVTVGAGALVTRDVAAGLTVVGIPAKPMQR